MAARSCALASSQSSEGPYDSAARLKPLVEQARAHPRELFVVVRRAYIARHLMPDEQQRQPMHLCPGQQRQQPDITRVDHAVILPRPNNLHQDIERAPPSVPQTRICPWILDLAAEHHP